MLAFLTELFILSVAGVDIPAIWKNSIIIPILKARKLREQGDSYRPISLRSPAAKILEQLLPTIVEALGTCSSQHALYPKRSTTSALLPISARRVSGFNKRKPPSRTIAIAVDISKAFESRAVESEENLRLWLLRFSNLWLRLLCISGQWLPTPAVIRIKNV